MLTKEISMNRGLHCKCSVYSIIEIPMHMHHAFEIVFVLKGSLGLTCQAFEYKLSRGDIFICNVNEPHTLSSTEEENLVLLFHLDPYPYETIFPHLSYYWFLCDSYRNPKKNDSSLKYLRHLLFHAFRTLSENKPPLPGQAEDLVINIVNHLINHYQNFSFAGKKHVLQSLKTGDNLAVKRIFEIQEYIYRNYQKKISLDDLSNHLYLNKYYVSRLIKSFTGLNLIDLLGLVRTEKAQILLLTTGLSLEEVSFECGFSSVKYFDKYFTQWYQLSPRFYRETKKEELQRKEAAASVISFDDPELLEIQNELLQSAVLGCSSFTHYAYEVHLDNAIVPFRHSWENSLYISDISTAIQLIDAISLSQCQKEIGFQMIEFHNLFERYAYYQNKSPFFDAGLLHLLRKIGDANLKTAFYLSLTEENVQETRDSFTAVIHLLSETFTPAETELFFFRIQTAHLKSDPTKAAMEEFSKILKQHHFNNAPETSSQHFLKETYSNNSMNLVPHVINCALTIKPNDTVPYRELFDIPGEDKKTNIPAFSYNGLFGPFGEKKPLYYAWHLLSLLGREKVFQDEGVLVTKSYTDYCILVYDPLQDRYLQNDSSAAGTTFTLNILTSQLKKFHVVQISLNSEKSLFQHLKNLQFPTRLSKNEINYLDQATAPEVTFSFLDLAYENTISISLNPCSAKLLILKSVG